MITMAVVLPNARLTMARELDEVIRELQLLQSVLRATGPSMPLATASTGLIGAQLKLRDVTYALGLIEAEEISKAVQHG